MYWLTHDDFGLQYGLIDQSNPAPKNSKIYENEKELDSEVEKLEKKIEKKMSNFFKIP